MRGILHFSAFSPPNGGFFFCRKSLKVKQERLKLIRSVGSREVIIVPSPLDSNVIGKVIVEDIFSKNNVLLMIAGTVLTKPLIERLQNYKIVEVNVAE
jgi:hypothetical protein